VLTKTVGKSRDDRKSCGGGGTLPKAHRKKATGVANEQKECFSENDMCYGGDGDDDYDYDYDDDDDDDRFSPFADTYRYIMSMYIRIFLCSGFAARSLALRIILMENALNWI